VCKSVRSEVLTILGLRVNFELRIGCNPLRLVQGLEMNRGTVGNLGAWRCMRALKVRIWLPRPRGIQSQYAATCLEHLVPAINSAVDLRQVTFVLKVPQCTDVAVWEDCMRTISTLKTGAKVSSCVKRKDWAHASILRESYLAMLQGSGV